MNALRIGLIGAGENTRLRHIPGFQSLEGVQCEVVCNRSEQSARRVADEFGIPRIATHWREVIADPAIDAICIGTWPYLHAETTIAALESGKHVLVEARMASNAAEATKMRDAAAAHPDLVAQIVPAPFSLNHDATIRRIWPELGVLREARIIFSNSSQALASSPITWRQDAKLSGVNTLTLGILYETFQRWLGSADPEWISGTARTFTQERPNENGLLTPVTVPDSVTVMAGYPNGLALTAHVTGVTSGHPTSEIRVDGDRGSLRMDFLTQTLYFSQAGSSEEQVLRPDEGTQPGWQVEADFVASIREKQPVTLTNFTDGLRYMTFTQLAHDSWNAGGTRLQWKA